MGILAGAGLPRRRATSHNDIGRLVEAADGSSNRVAAYRAGHQAVERNVTRGPYQNAGLRRRRRAGKVGR
jgi:hypothetical protein